MGMGLKTLAQRIVHHFPFYFHDEIVFYKTEEFDSALFMQRLAAEYHAHLQGDSIVADTPVSISKIPIRVNFQFKPDNVTGNVSFSLSLLESNLALIISSVFSFFFLSYNDTLFGYLSIIAGILFYFINIHISVTAIKRSIIKISGTPFDLGEPELWKKQQVWMKDPLLCPACGEPKNPYSYKCVNCGIYFSNPTKQPSDEQVNTTGSEQIVYQYRNKHEKNSR
jgi:hypothetical protein